MANTEQLKKQLAERWVNDVVDRAEDIFNVRTSLGEVIPLKIPEPQKEMLRDGILGKGRKLVDEGLTFMSVLNKGRQIGFSLIAAVETILIAEDYPNTFIYYIADDLDQTIDFLDKVTQLSKDANYYPEQLGGGPILNIQDTSKALSKTINDTKITGLSGRAKGGKRGKNAIHVIFDEMAWAISVKNEQQDIWDVIQYYVRQGGSVRLQSTPRTTDDLFWQFYSEPQKFGMKSYYCPVITNWKEIDLDQPFYIDLDNERRIMKQFDELTDEEINNLIETYSKNPRYTVDIEKKELYQKNVIIPYPWVKLEELEKKRYDKEKFMQENLGVSVDEKYKVIPSAWIYRNIIDEPEWEDRRNSKNPFYILVDLAQANDITAITIVEKLPDDTVVERMLDMSQEPYDIQVERIWSHYHSFKPQYISIDNTGHGRVIGDLLEKKLRMASLPLTILHRVDFTSSSKEVMAVGFRRLVQADKYKFLNSTDLHRRSIRHVERVEKEVLETNIRYSGKRWGRDDFFWSKAQVVYFTNLYLPPPGASFGKVKVKPFGRGLNLTAEESPRTEFEKIKEDINEDNRSLKDISRIKAIAKVINELSVGAISCPKVNETRTPIFCTGCDRVDCMEYDYMKKVCDSVGVEPKVVWKKQRKYKVEE